MMKSKKNTVSRQTLPIRIVRFIVTFLLCIVLAASFSVVFIGKVLDKTVDNEKFYLDVITCDEMVDLVESELENDFITRQNVTGIPKESLQAGYNRDTVKNALIEYANNISLFASNGGKFELVEIDVQGFSGAIDEYVNSFLIENGVEPSKEMLKEIDEIAEQCAANVENRVNIFDFSMLEGNAFNKLTSLMNKLNGLRTVAVIATLLICLVLLVMNVLGRSAEAGLLIPISVLWFTAFIAFIVSKNIVRIDIAGLIPFVDGTSLKLLSDGLVGAFAEAVTKISTRFFTVSTVFLVSAILGYSFKCFTKKLMVAEESDTAEAEDAESSQSQLPQE